MLRALLVLFFVCLAVSCALASGAGGGRSTPRDTLTDDASGLVLRGRQGSSGPWRRYLWLKLVKTDIISFSVCGVRNQITSPTCAAARGNTLPRGTMLRLEQRRRTGRRPTWRTVGISSEPALQAVLSNTISGNRLGTVSYRLTLRNASNRILQASNAFKVYWRR